MTDLEISKALALSIGWTSFQIGLTADKSALLLFDMQVMNNRRFDYRDWNVIGPIAERYDCFPERCCGEWSAMIATKTLTWVEADTSQKAIALAVIEGAKK